MKTKFANTKILNWFLLFALFLGFGCKQKSSNAEKPSLSFFIVRTQNFDGGRYFHTAEFPKLGYIAEMPDLIVVQLEGVNVTSSLIPNILIDQNGNKTDGGMVTNSLLHIELMPDDAKKFESLTKRAVGNQVLILLGNKPLIAPKIYEPISTQQILLTADKNRDQTKLEKELKKLVKSAGLNPR